jgi:hypothetical protein
LPTLEQRRQVLALLPVIAAQRKRLRTMPDVIREAQPSPLAWATDKATVIHPIRGRMPFEPYAYQAAFLEDRSPRRIVVKARQIGFSQVIALEALHQALFEPDSTILMVSRTGDLAVNLLRYCYNALATLGGAHPAVTTENQAELGFANGSRIKSLPANRSTGRGFAAKNVYLDEYAYQDYAEDIYRSISPILGHGGRLTVCSTPNGRANHFFQLWEGFEGGDWSRHLVPWRDCPAYDDDWYERERPNYTAQQWASEYECDFVASGQAVFKADDIRACADGWRGEQPYREGRRYVTAWDIGRRTDATVGVTLDVTDPVWQIVAFDRVLGIPYPQIQALIDARVRAYPGTHYVESNGVGDPVLENLTTRATPFITTAKTKVQAITALALALENRALKHDYPEITRELNLYQWDDRALVQDCVMALAIAVSQAAKPRWGVFD